MNDEPQNLSFLEGAAAIVAVVLLIELLFYLIVRFCLVPKANIRLPPAAYRDYGDKGERHLILLRILERVEKYARFKNKPVKGAIANKILGWFQREYENDSCDQGKSLKALTSNQDGDTDIADPSISPPSSPASDVEENSLRAAAATSRRLRFRGQPSRGPHDIICESNHLKGRGDEEDEGLDDFGMENVIHYSDGTWTIKGLGLTDMSKLFAWVLFSKDIADLEGWEKDELDQGFRIGQQRLGLVFHDDNKQHGDDAVTLEKKRPLLMSLEDVKISHKPLTIYMFVYMIKFATSAMLRCLGFRRIVTRSGLVAWFRPAQENRQEDEQELIQLQPLLFFHGVSPAPLAICLPMILNGLASDRRRALVLFENPTISWSISFHALSEHDTLDGVQQVVHEYLDTTSSDKQSFVIAGHSFGSCCVTWITRSPTLRGRIGQIILLDPVTILLSEPSVVVNFLYASRARSDLLEIVSTELFTQYYIRRHFSWYNSELWLQDVPSHVPITIALSGKDDIVDAPSVREHVLQFKQEHGSDRRGSIELLYWPNLPHAMCVAFPDKWEEIKQAIMVQQDLSVT